jgi:hypothetical protein
MRLLLAMKRRAFLCNAKHNSKFDILASRKSHTIVNRFSSNLPFVQAEMSNSEDGCGQLPEIISRLSLLRMTMMLLFYRVLLIRSPRVI